MVSFPAGLTKWMAVAFGFSFRNNTRVKSEATFFLSSSLRDGDLYPTTPAAIIPTYQRAVIRDQATNNTVAIYFGQGFIARLCIVATGKSGKGTPSLTQNNAEFK